jgi:hypothetical protein
MSFSAFGVQKLVEQQFIVYTLVYQVIVYILHFFPEKLFKNMLWRHLEEFFIAVINNCIGLCFWDVVTEMSWLDLNGGLAVGGLEYVPVNDKFCVSDAVMSYFTLLLKLRRWNRKLDEVCRPIISCYIAHCPGFLVF